MRWKTQPLLAGAFTLARAAPAYAGGFWFNSAHMSIPANPAIGLGLQNISDFNIIAVDAAFKAGDKVVIRPGVGQCPYSSEGYSDNQTVYGASVGVQVWKDESGKVAVNLQAGGAAMNLYHDSYDTGTGTETYSSNDLSIFAGVAYRTGNFILHGGVANFNYEGGSETALNVGASVELGGMSNAFRAIGSLFRNR